MNWTQPICAARWNQDYGSTRDPQRLVDIATDETGGGDLERCCYCNKPTCSGLYVRLDPETVPWPR